MPAAAPSTSPPHTALGWCGFALGALALLATIVVFWAGPFAPQQPAGVSIGEIAADVARSAARAVTGQPRPEPLPVARTIDDHLGLATGLLAALAIVLAFAAFVRREDKRAAFSGLALGGLALGVQLFTLWVMLFVVAVVVVVVVYALPEILGDIF